MFQNPESMRQVVEQRQAGSRERAAMRRLARANRANRRRRLRLVAGAVLGTRS